MDDGLVRDARFARLHTDPRFQRMPKKERKAVADDRFAAMYEDADFDDDAKVVDKRGMLQKKEKVKKKKKVAPPAPAPVAPKAQQSSTGVDDRPATKKKKEKGASKMQLQRQREEEESRRAIQRQMAMAMEEEDDEDDEGDDEEGDEPMTESATDSDSDGEDADDGGEASALVAWLQQAEAVPRVKDGTTRLAVVNCNWDQVRAVDVLAVVRSFLPAGGRIKSVAVYPSEFGEQRMAEEATVGPGGLIAKRELRASGGDDDDEAEAGGEDGDEGELDDNAVNENLRKYELDRLKYYFAVVTFDVCVYPPASCHASEGFGPQPLAMLPRGSGHSLLPCFRGIRATASCPPRLSPTARVHHSILAVNRRSPPPKRCTPNATAPSSSPPPSPSTCASFPRT